MKLIHTVGIAVLLVVAAAWWFSGSGDRISASSSLAVSSDLPASQPVAASVETSQRQGPRQTGTPSTDLSAGHDVAPGNPMAAPAGNAALSTPGPGQVALRDAAETVPKQTADTRTSQPSEIDKTDCEAAKKTLDESWAIFDVTPTQAVHYTAKSQSSDPNASTSGFIALKPRLSAALCTGTTAFNQDYAPEMEFVAISPDSHARILLGDVWISDGTVVSFLSESDQQNLANWSGTIQFRRRMGVGPGKNISRESFERQLAQNPRALIGAP